MHSLEQGQLLGGQPKLSMTTMEVIDAREEGCVEVDRAVVDAVDLKDFERIVDIGGGTGGLARQIAASYPRARVILFDREHVLSMAPAGESVEVISGNFFENVPQADAYFLKFVLHDWDDMYSRAILRNCRKAMPVCGRVFVIEVLVPTDTTASMAKTHDINMLVLTGGRERSGDEYTSLFTAAGLELIGIIPTAAGVSVLEARRLPTSGTDQEG
jgi:ubiquinone/menaquinone biosynthesis C-methylase UbiE